MKEFDLIASRLRSLSGRPGLNLLDDVAVLSDQPESGWVITSDTLVEGTHFRSSDPLASVGSKLVRVNVSDLFAKAAEPQWAILNLTWPKDRQDHDLSALIDGLASDLERFGIKLIGGDTTTSKSDVVLSLTLFGRPLRERGPVLRSGGSPHEDLWLSAPVGDGYLGLNDPQSYPHAAGHYLEPRLASAEQLELIARHATGSLDVSDGLVADASHLAAASGLAIEIESEACPLSVDGRRFVGQSADTDRLITLLTGGDDYCVLFTAPVESRASLERAMHRIGSTCEGKGVKVIGRDGEPLQILKGGYEHGSTE